MTSINLGPIWILKYQWQLAMCVCNHGWRQIARIQLVW